jgi:hypothetical protein
VIPLVSYQANYYTKFCSWQPFQKPSQFQKLLSYPHFVYYLLPFIRFRTKPGQTICLVIPEYTYNDQKMSLNYLNDARLHKNYDKQETTNASIYANTPEHISIKSTLNKIQYSTQLILVLNKYFKKVLKFESILVLFQIKLLNVLNQH